MPSSDRPGSSWFDRDRSLWWAAFVVLALAGAAWALASPLMSIPDEPAHAIMAVAVWRGDLRGDLVDLPPGNPAHVPRQVIDRVPQAYADLHDEPTCFKARPNVTADCEPDVGTDETVVRVGSPAGRYPPLYYVLVGWPSRLLDPAPALYVMRLASAVLGAALLASALVSARAVGRRAFAVVGVVLAVTPMTFFLLGSINPNGFEIAAAIASAMALLDLLAGRGPPATRLLVRVAVCSACFVAARPLSPLFVALVVGLALVAALRLDRLRELLADTRVRVAAAATAIVMVASGLLMVLGPPPLAGPGRPDLSFGQAIRAGWGMEVGRGRQMIGVFGWFDATPPVWFAQLWLGAVALLVLAALVLDRTVRRRLALLLAIAAAVVVPLLVEAEQVQSVGLFWQGRYTLPLAVAVPLLAAWMVADASALDRRWIGRASSIAAVVVAVGVALLQLYGWAAALSRYAVGDVGDVLGYLGSDAAWRPPLGPVALTIVAVIGFGGWAAVVAVVAIRRRPEGSATPTPASPAADLDVLFASIAGEPAPAP